jgi:pantoate--beta-alanine ligase
MGALHAGHLSLVQQAREECVFVIASIFVNPTQFGPAEDFRSYPRSEEADVALCSRAGVDCVFCPAAGEMYSADALTEVRVSGISDDLCGAHRPGHFTGVALVVAKLFNIVQPDRAYFGQKDAQQCAVIQRMVRDLNFPVEIVVCPTVREPDGLALSSRNVYLSAGERMQATAVYRSLRVAHDAVRAGSADVGQLERLGRTIIEQSGPCTIDYWQVVDPLTFQPVSTISGVVLALVAVRIGNTRLIDNLVIDPYADRG